MGRYAQRGRTVYDLCKAAQRGMTVTDVRRLEKHGGKSGDGVAQSLCFRSGFRLAATPQTFKDLDSWIRHRLRAIQLKHWRVGRTVYSRLRALGASHELAAMITGGAGHWWGHSEAGLNRVLTVQYSDSLGFPRLA